MTPKPRGWFLAQGLVPLYPVDRGDKRRACELPNGQNVCGSHGLVLCHRCRTNYGVVKGPSNDDFDDDDEDDEVLYSVTEEMYWGLSPAARAEICVKWGPPCRPNTNKVSAFLSCKRSLINTIARAAYLTLERASKKSSAIATSSTSPPSASAPIILYAGGCQIFQSDPAKTSGHATSSTNAPRTGAQIEMPSVMAHPVRADGSIASSVCATSSTASAPTRTVPSASYTSRADLLHPKPRKGTGRVFPTMFNPHSSTVKPTELFRVNPQAGWAFVQGPGEAGKPPRTVTGRLENKGPFGDPATQTSNRAELRAVIAALGFRNWAGEGYRNVVIATDSEVQKWLRTASNGEVRNQDLWENLLGEVEKHHERGLSVEFWRIPREWNWDADKAAKRAATEKEIMEWAPVMDVC
ncbi:ribonuclease H-like protein [Xylariaceae sp. FL0594]|nr:ribonuclease H-like protein [Xylariaceae sp. FL0594]